jgi:hypothetical protein
LRLQAAGQDQRVYGGVVADAVDVGGSQSPRSNPRVELIREHRGGGNGERHTWVHPHVAPDLAAWCSPTFRAAVSSLVFRYMSGQVTTEESRTVAARLGVTAQALPPADVRLTGFVSSLQWLGMKPDENPRFQQAIRDITGDIMGVSRPQLPAAAHSTERWAGVVEIAEQMGHAKAINLDVRTKLGRYVSNHGAWDEDSDGYKRRKEERLCNGTMRKIWVYLDTPEIRAIIDDYFLEGSGAEL